MKDGIIKKSQKEIRYQISKKSKKNIILKISEEGIVKISIPKYSTYKAGENIIKLNFDKIHVKVAEIKKTYKEKLDKPYIKILGIDMEKNGRTAEIILLEEAKKTYNDLLKKWIPKIGVSPERVRIKNMKTAWGICYSNKNITLNLKLVQADIKIIEYVIVHELCHLLHMNHSKEFWQLVEYHLPTFREEKLRLKSLQKDKSYFN